MADEQEYEPLSPPDTMTECCSRFFKEREELLDFIGFIVGSATRTEEVGRVLSETLLNVADTAEDREHYERSLEEGLGVLKKLGTHGQLILQTMLNRAVDNYLTYISELMALSFRTRPETLRSSETVRLDTVLKHDTMDDLISDLADKRVNQLSHQGMSHLAAYLSDKLGFDLFEWQEDLQRAVLAIEVRNLIVHNRAVVNAHFLSRLPDYPASAGEVIKAERKVRFRRCGIPRPVCH
jgi:hypothetical protein